LREICSEVGEIEVAVRIDEHENRLYGVGRAA
jgi:hypothetical protein